MALALGRVGGATTRHVASWTLGAQAGRHVATATLDTQVVTFTATAAEPLSLGAIRHLRLATFDGSGEGVHPDVARVPGGWAPARRFLAVTPYPGGEVNHELPSIYESGDPAEWNVPAGVTNPIVKPWKGYLSDPDLLFEPQRRQLWMYFRHVEERNSVFLTVSADGTHWSRPARVVSAPNHELVSPAIVRVSENNWHMWAVNAGPAGCQSRSTTVEHRTSIDGLHWSAPRRSTCRDRAHYLPGTLTSSLCPSSRNSGRCTTRSRAKHARRRRFGFPPAATASPGHSTRLRLCAPA